MAKHLVLSSLTILGAVLLSHSYALANQAPPITLSVPTAPTQPPVTPNTAIVESNELPATLDAPTTLCPCSDIQPLPEIESLTKPHLIILASFQNSADAINQLADTTLISATPNDNSFDTSSPATVVAATTSSIPTSNASHLAGVPLLSTVGILAIGTIAFTLKRKISPQ